ncbi:hypothetical protein CUR178_08042 [Leishmania enriettii]|uniref:Phosphatidylinositol N-acetylglucosaminyltransferase subunit H conserved domain-containing protein n=1 Tax=Leishmania enriettii TaxID=5663 RepID=A0A836HF74_LEIEN|nr:hypothetical protein CUR178_08042 [Leishmania enriettii]
MQSRRSKVVPEPLLYPERAMAMAAANSSLSAPGASASSASAAKPSGSLPAAMVSKVPAGHSQNGAQRPLQFDDSASSVLPLGTTARGGVSEVFSPSLNVYRAGSSGTTFTIAPKTTVLATNHVTNTGAVVRLVQVDYSKAMRAYRVCRQEGGIVAEEQPQRWHCAAVKPATPLLPATSSHGASSHDASPTAVSGAASPNSHASNAVHNGEEALGHNPAPWRLVLMRLFGATDMVLLAVAVACSLVVVSRLRMVTLYRQGDWQNAASSSSLLWLTVAVAALSSRRAVVDNAAASSGSPPASGEGVLQGVARSSWAASSLAESIATSAPALKSATSVSFTQVTSTPALDTSLTLVLLLLSTFLLVKRLSGALSRVYVEEVLVMRGVGLQFSAYGIFNTLRYRRFVDLLMLRSLVIHDAFFRYQPIFFLSSSVENKAERIVYFPETLPRLAVLRLILNGIRGVLYGEPEDGLSLAEMEERWRKSAGDVCEGDFFTEDSFADDTATTPDDACLSDATDREED